MGLFSKEVEQPGDTLVRKRAEYKELIETFKTLKQTPESYIDLRIKLAGEIAVLVQTVGAILRANELANQVRVRQHDLLCDAKSMGSKHD